MIEQFKKYYSQALSPAFAKRGAKSTPLKSGLSEDEEGKRAAVLTHDPAVVFSAIMEQGRQIISRCLRLLAMEVEGCR